MAKRLNKKIAIIGTLVLAVIVFGIILFVLAMSVKRNPQQYIKEAQAKLSLKEPDYKGAEKAYGYAFAYAKKNTKLKIDILFKLVDMYLSENDWRKAAGCWNKVINFDTNNLKARVALLNYSYDVAQSGVWSAWKDVETNASELIDKELDKSPRIYRMKGQAMLELVRRGQMTDKEKGINDTLAILKQVNESEPNNVDTYLYLADGLTQKGEILAAKGILNANENAHTEAIKILKKGVELNPNEPKAYINLYSSEIIEAKGDKEKIAKIESDIIKLTQKFPNNANVYFALSQLYYRNPKTSDKALAALDKAFQLDKQNVNYSLSIASLYYKKYLTEQNPQNMQKAIDMAKEALTFPEALDVQGPKARTNIINRYSLHSFLANCYLDKASISSNEVKTATLDLAEKEIYELNQILGTVENPYSIMWKGRLQFAKGQKNEGIKLMYDAYQKLTTADSQQGDPQIGILAYELAKAFENSPESGVVGTFYLTAYRNRMFDTKPQMLLDFTASMMKMRDWKHAIELLDNYDQLFGEDKFSRELRISAYIGGNMYEQTEEQLAKVSDSDPNILRLKNLHLNAILNKTAWDMAQNQPAPGQTATAQQTTQTAQLKAKLEQTKIESTKVRDKLAIVGIKVLSENEFADMCRRYVADADYKKAGLLVDNYLVVHPNSVNAEVLKLVLAEPSPVNVPPKRNEEITLKVIENMKTPVDRETLLGGFYQASGDTTQAVSHYRKVLETAPDNANALYNLFNIAINDKDFSQAEKVADTAIKYNIDLCDGDFVKAKLAYAKKDYQGCIDKVNTCLEKRPIFSEAYLLRSQAYTALNKETEAIADAKKAYEFNPYDNIIPRNLAFVLYTRDQKLGASASIDQMAETKNALITAIRANPRDVDLQNFYAKYISNNEPDNAIAVSQQIQKMQPTVANSLWLGSLAMDVATKKGVSKPQQYYYSIALNAFENAYKIDPNDSRVLTGYSECLRTMGKIEEGEKILKGHDDLLWRYYTRTGNIDEASKIIGKLYDASPKDINNVKGMLFVARTKLDQANILKYSGELVKLDKSLENQIIQIESCLEIGLSDEAKGKLDSLTEQYPNDARLAFLNAWLSAKQGKLADSLKLANKNIELDPANPRAWRLRGQIYSGLNSFNEAISDFQKSKSLSDNADVRIDLARAYVRTNSAQQAISELKIAADEQGSVTARNLLEEVYFSTGNTEQVSKFYNETLTKYPDNVYWLNHAGNFCLNTKEYERAAKFFDSAFQSSLKINKDAPDPEAFDGKLRTLLLTKKYDVLQAEATKYIDTKLSPIAYERMAEAKSSTGDKDGSLQYFKRALEKAGTDQTYLIGILSLMNNVIGYDETLKWCNEKIQTQPDSPAVNLALYYLYNIKQQYNKALEHLDKCIALAKNDEQQSLTMQMNKTKLLLTMYEKMSDKQYLNKAIAEYESLLKKQPTNIEVMNNLAYLLADSDTDAAKSLDYGKKAYQGAPNNAGVLDTYAYVLFKNNKLQDADEFINRAIQQYEQNKMNAPIEVYEHMALIKEKLGQNDKALDAYKRALEFAGSNATPEVKTRITAAIEKLKSK